MSDLLNTYFRFAQLSLASYADLQGNLSDYVARLVQAGLTQSLADTFAAQYTVKSHLSDTIVGFSATLFEKTNPDGTKENVLSIRGTNDTADVLVDLVSVALAGSAELNPQYVQLKSYLDFLLNPDNGFVQANEKISITGHSLGGFLAQALATEPSYVSRIDKVYTYNAPGFGGPVADVLQALGIPNPLIGQVPPGKVTNLIASDGISSLAGLGVHIGEIETVFIESLVAPLDPVHNHLIAPLVDALAVFDLFGKIDPDITTGQITKILNATSAQAGNSLELSLQALNKLFLGEDIQPLIATRDDLYAKIQELSQEPSVVGQSKTFFSLVGAQAIDLAIQAQASGELGLATRYALKELNPFIVLGANYTPHNQDQGNALEFVDPDTGIGQLTDQYVSDRASFLARKIEVNVTDNGVLTQLSNVFADTHFQDFRTSDEIAAGGLVFTPRQFLFGSDNAETLTGNSASDHLYGGDGVDSLFGQAGRDYLEGNLGNDTLDGGADADTMLGGQGEDAYIVDNAGDIVTEYANNGIDTVTSSVAYKLTANVEDLVLMGSAIAGTGNELANLITGNDQGNVLIGGGGQDHLIGGIGTDRLLGEGGNDLLEGGANDDLYFYDTGGGTDQVEDNQGRNAILVDQQILTPGLHLNTDAADTYRSADGRFTYTLANGELRIATGAGGELILNQNFQSGDFGVMLIEEREERMAA